MDMYIFCMFCLLGRVWY